MRRAILLDWDFSHELLYCCEGSNVRSFVGYISVLSF